MTQPKTTRPSISSSSTPTTLRAPSPAGITKASPLTKLPHHQPGSDRHEQQFYLLARSAYQPAKPHILLASIRTVCTNQFNITNYDNKASSVNGTTPHSIAMPKMPPKHSRYGQNIYPKITANNYNSDYPTH